MNVTILSKEDSSVEVEIGGQDHTLLNVLKDSLLRLEDVEAATYDMNPEQSGSKTDPILYVETVDSDPLDAIEEAANNLQEDAESFEEEVRAAL